MERTVRALLAAGGPGSSSLRNARQGWTRTRAGQTLCHVQAGGLLPAQYCGSGPGPGPEEDSELDTADMGKRCRPQWDGPALAVTVRHGFVLAACPNPTVTGNLATTRDYQHTVAADAVQPPDRQRRQTRALRVSQGSLSVSRHTFYLHMPGSCIPAMITVALAPSAGRRGPYFMECCLQPESLQ